MFPELSSTPDFCGELCYRSPFHLAHLRHALMSNAIAALAINGRSSCITVHPDHLQRESQAQIGEHLSKASRLRSALMHISFYVTT
jgi:hypothetical protein